MADTVALGNRAPSVDSGFGRSDTSEMAGGSATARVNSVTTSPWRLTYAGAPYTVTVGGVDYTLNESDTYQEIP